GGGNAVGLLSVIAASSLALRITCACRCIFSRFLSVHLAPPEGGWEVKPFAVINEVSRQNPSGKECYLANAVGQSPRWSSARLSILCPNQQLRSNDRFRRKAGPAIQRPALCEILPAQEFFFRVVSYRDNPK